jgi:hypothetical protein
VKPSLSIETPLTSKVIVTDHSLAHWIAQTYNLDINHWPKKRPDHLTKEVYEQLKRITKQFATQTDTSPEITKGSNDPF